jgi:hypothetical protein
VSWLSVLTVVGTALGGVGGVAGGLAAFFKLLVPYMRERRLNRVTNRCFEAKTKADREHALEVLRTTLNQPGEQDLGIEVTPKAPRQRRATKALTSASSETSPPTSS